MVSTVGEMQGCDFSEGGRLEPRRPEGLVGEAAPGKGAGVSEVGGGADLRAGPSRVLGPLSPPPPPAKHRTDPVTSVLGAEWTCGPTEGEGVVGAPPSALPTLSREWEPWPERAGA